MGMKLYDRLIALLEEDENIEAVIFRPRREWRNESLVGREAVFQIGSDLVPNNEDKVILSLERAKKYLTSWNIEGWRPKLKVDYEATRSAVVWTDKRILWIEHRVTKIEIDSMAHYPNTFRIELIPRSPQAAMDMWGFNDL